MAIKFLNTATAATQAAGDNSTKIATTAYADAAASAIPIGNYVTLATAQTISGAKTFSDGPYFNGTTYWRVSSADAALQRADARDDGTNYSRLHWYGKSVTDATSNFRHAYYDGANYINVTAASGRLSFGGKVAGSTPTAAGDFATKAYADGLTPGAGVFLPLVGGTLTGALTGTSATFSSNITSGSTTKTTSNVIRSLAGDTVTAGFEAYGASQGTGYAYVGQSSSHGGGMFYNGDGTPTFATGEAADRVSFYRRTANANTVVFEYPHNSSTVTFKGSIVVGGTVTGQNIYGNQFVDAQDNAYYANPAATSVMKGASFDGDVTVTTQAVGDDSTLVATTEYADRAAANVPIGNYVTLATAQTITGAKTIDTLKIGSANKIQFANNDFIRYEDATGVGRFHFDSDGGTNNSSVQAATFVGALSGNATTASTAATSNLIKVNDYAGATDMRILGSHQTGGSDNVYSASTMFLNCDTGIINATGFVGNLNGTINTATVGTTQTAGTGGTLIATCGYADAAAGAIPIGNYLPLAGGTMGGTLSMGGQTLNLVNGSITNVNSFTFNDPGVNEGIKWNGGNLWQIYESPNAQTNASGNLQFVQNTTRRLTINTGGDVEIVSGNLTVGGGTVTLGSIAGRLTGIVTILSGSDATNKTYVDNAIAGVPQGDITGVASGTGMTGGGTSGTVTLNVIGGSGITANANDITVDSTVIRTSGGQGITGTLTVDQVGNNSASTRDKLRVWSGSTYTIGMMPGYGYGGLGGNTTGTEYAMSFQMSNSTNRGWWWGDTSHTNLQGAMSLTTTGKAVIATSLSVGYGESVRTAAIETLEVNGKVKANGIKLMSGTTEYLNTGSYSSNAYIWGYATGSTIYFGQPATWTQNIQVNGTATATNFILSSDKTLKNKIKEIDTNHIDVNWKNFELKSEPGVKRAGVIAQELEEKHPEFVRTDDEGMKSVAYIDLLIAKIAELEARLDKANI